MIKFCSDVKEDNVSDGDVDYYKGIFIDLGCPAAYAVRLAMGHIGETALTRIDKDIKNFMLQGFPYTTAKSMAEDEQAWR